MAVSVIIPTHNRSALLSEAVDSVLAQADEVHEIIVVDDRSEEPHRSAVRALAQRSPLIRVHEMPVHGERSRARNEGLTRATGDYVLFLDDDDLLDAGAIASALRSFAADPCADVVVGGGRWFGEVGPRHAAPLDPFWTDSAADPDGWASQWMGVSAATRRDLARHPVRVLLKCAPPIHARLARREAIGTTRFPEDVHEGEDWIFWLDLAVKGCRFRLSPHGPAYVRRHPGNARRTASAVAAYQRVMTRAASIGREETFLAAAQWTRICWLEGRTDWWRPALTQAKHPDLLVRYACQFLLRRAFPRLAARNGRRPDRADAAHRNAASSAGITAAMTARSPKRDTILSRRARPRALASAGCAAMSRSSRAPCATSGSAHR
jgi:hypothetical protein